MKDRCCQNYRFHVTSWGPTLHWLGLWMHRCMSWVLNTCVLSVYLSVCLSVCLSVYLSIYLSIHPSIYLSKLISIDLSIYLSKLISIDLYRSVYLRLSISFYLFLFLSLSMSILWHKISAGVVQDILARFLRNMSARGLHARALHKIPVQPMHFIRCLQRRPHPRSPRESLDTPLGASPP